MKIRKIEKENPEYNYKMIILARESRGLGQQELADMIGMNPGNLSRVEKGMQTPMKDMVERIAKSLDYPIQFFKQRRETFNMDAPYYRKRLQIPKKELLKSEANVNILGFNIDTLLSSVELPEPNYPRVNLKELGIKANEAATYVRQFWNIPKGKLENLVNLLEDNGILVVNMDFEGTAIDGLSIVTENKTPIIFINRSIPADRYRLTLAHEFGHLVMHIDSSYQCEDCEKEAFLFAGELLMPKEEIKDQLQDLDIDKLKTLKPVWKVSMGALIKRAQTLETITDNQYQYLWKQMTKLGYKMKEPEELDFPKEQPTLLKEMIDTHIEELDYSEEELASHLCLSMEEFKEKFLNKSRLRVIPKSK